MLTRATTLLGVGYFIHDWKELPDEYVPVICGIVIACSIVDIILERLTK